MSKVKTGVTRNGVMEVCRWDKPSACPRHVTHDGAAMKVKSLEGLTVESPENNVMNVFDDSVSYHNGRKVLLKTVHGSHLYGLNHADSDMDFYIVVEDANGVTAKAKQTIVDGVDTTVVGYGTFMEMCFKGVPQALEAMFSGKATIDEFKAFREAYKAGGAGVVDVYRRTIYNFATEKREGLKYKKHAVRLMLNLNSLLTFERFNPTLTVKEIQTVNRLYMLPQEEFVSEINSASIVSIFD